MASRWAKVRRRRAFTIVEMAIVVLVLGILTAVAAPKYRTALAMQRADAVARRVAADLRLARNYAKKVSQPQTVTFNLVAESYAMSSMPALDKPSTIYSVALGGSANYSAEIVTADFGGASSVQFDIYGKPNNAGSVTLRTSGRQSVVQVDGAGLVTIQ
jgi:prepilin-type N-terminal cleavage/methylation domain-containing protein